MSKKHSDHEEKEKSRAFIEKLQEASHEINSVKGSFLKGIEDLAKIHNLLSIDRVNELSKMLQSYEDRLSEAERMKEETAEGVRRHNEEFEKEKKAHQTMRCLQNQRRRTLSNGRICS